MANLIYTLEEFKKDNDDLLELLSDSKVGIIGHLPGAYRAFRSFSYIMKVSLEGIVKSLSHACEKLNQESEGAVSMLEIVAQRDLFQKELDLIGEFEEMVNEPWTKESKSYLYNVELSDSWEKSTLFVFFSDAEKEMFKSHLFLTNVKGMRETLQLVDKRYSYRISEIKGDVSKYRISCMRKKSKH